MTRRVNLTAACPPNEGESNAEYMVRLAKEARRVGIFRQCSIGWHDECSDPHGYDCMCRCHALGITLTRDQLEAWAGRELSDDEVQALDNSIGESSVPEAIMTITDSLSSPGE